MSEASASAGLGARAFCDHAKKTDYWKTEYGLSTFPDVRLSRSVLCWAPGSPEPAVRRSERRVRRRLVCHFPGGGCLADLAAVGGSDQFELALHLQMELERADNAPVRS